MQCLRGARFQLAQIREAAFLLGQGRAGLLGAVDDLAQPGALVRLGVRDVVLKFFLQLEGGTHVLLGLREGCFERFGLLRAVLQLRELQFLFGMLNGIVRLDQARTGALVQFRERDQRPLRGSIAPPRRYVALPGLVPTAAPLAHQRYHAHAGGGDSAQHDDAADYPARTVDADAAQRAVDAVHGAHGGTVPIAVAQSGNHVVGINVLDLGLAQGPGITREHACLPRIGGHGQYRIVAAETVDLREFLDPVGGVRGIRELIHHDHVEGHVVLAGHLVDALLHLGLITQRVGRVHDARSGIHGGRGLGESRLGRDRQRNACARGRYGPTN